MKRFVSMALAACMLLSMAPAAWAESGAEYIPAPYNAAEADPTATYLEPAFYAKDQYMSAEVLAQSPSGSYAYKDADGNLYVAGFGLSY